MVGRNNIRWLAGCAALFLVSACAQHSGQSAVCGDEAALQRLFAQEVRPATQGCASCHAGQRPPPFAVADETAAFKAAYPYLIGTGESRLVQQAGNGHCGDPAICGNSATMKAAVEAFRAGVTGQCHTEQEPSGPNRIRSAPAAMAGITEATNNPNRFIALNFPDAPAPFTNARVYAEVVEQVQTDATEDAPQLCRIRTLRGAFPAHARVRELAIYVDDTWVAAAKNYLSLDVVLRLKALTVAPGSLPSFVRTAQTFVCNDLATARLAISADVTASEPPANGADVGIPELTPRQFFDNYVANMINTRCAGCHNPSHPSYALSGTLDERYALTKTKLTLSSPLTSPLWVRPQQLNGAVHPVAVTFQNNELERLRSWIEREAAAR